MSNRIVLVDESGEEIFSGVSIASDPPPAPVDEDACPPTKRSVAPPFTEESGVFVRDVTPSLRESAIQKKVDEHAA